jgi:hypothetical protein
VPPIIGWTSYSPISSPDGRAADDGICLWIGFAVALPNTLPSALRELSPLDKLALQLPGRNSTAGPASATHCLFRVPFRSHQRCKAPSLAPPLIGWVLRKIGRSRSRRKLSSSCGETFSTAMSQASPIGSGGCSGCSMGSAVTWPARILIGYRAPRTTTSCGASSVGNSAANCEPRS